MQRLKYGLPGLRSGSFAVHLEAAPGATRFVFAHRARTTPTARYAVRRTGVACLAGIVLAIAGCSAEPRSATIEDELPDTLSALQLYAGDLARLQPARDVVPYEINSTSFYDYADCALAIKLPGGQSIRYLPDGTLEYPVGTLLAQTLSYADADRPGQRRIVETRVLTRRADKWLGFTYVWNDEQNDAQLELFGRRIPIRRRLADGGVALQSHIVPDFNECKRCHRIHEAVRPIAATVRQLNCRPAHGQSGQAQLQAWQRAGLIQGLPPIERLPRAARWDDAASVPVDKRARAWLEANCAHCHNEGGAARHSGLRLAADISQPSAIGVLKTPIAAGRGTGGLPFDIVPGQPQLSIMLHRVRSTEAGVMMPEFGRTVVHAEGAALLSQWIASMPAAEHAFAGLVGIVEDLQPNELAVWAADALAQGDARRGEAVFQRESLNCKKCHAIRGSGGNVGPDLAGITRPVTAEHVVESVLLPNKVVKEGFRAVTVQTNDGLVLTGVQVSDNGFEIVLRDPVRGDTAIAKSSIAERVEGASLMPTNLVASLKREELLDLVRYLFELNASTPATGSQAPVIGP